MVLISLIGEQPAPNLLPTRKVQPQFSVMVCTDRTRKIAERLQVVLQPMCSCGICVVDAYNIVNAQKHLSDYIDNHYPSLPLMLNLTGGTKPMSMAAFLVAQARGAPVMYFQSEGNRSRLLTYRWHDAALEVAHDDELTETISLVDYLDLYLGAYEQGQPRDDLEREVHEVLAAIPGLECFTSIKPQGLGALEIDFVLRYGNQIAVGEAKRKGAKDGIDQINAVANPLYFGTYVHKFLFSGRVLDKNNNDLAKAYNITVIELASYGRDGTLSNEDQSTLVGTVLGRMRR